MTHSNWDMTRSNWDTTCSNGDISRSNRDITRSNRDITRSNRDTTCSNWDTTRIPWDITRIPWDITRIPWDITHIPWDMARSNGDMTRSNKDISHIPKNISHIPKDISHILKDISHILKIISHILKDISCILKNISRIPWNITRNPNSPGILRNVTTNEYDGNDNVLAMADGNNSSITQVFDELNRLTNRNITPGYGVAGDTTWESFTYDALSRLIGASNNNSTISRQYDSLSNLLTESQYSMGINKTVTSSYDPNGMNRLSLNYPSQTKTVNFTPDNLNRIQNIASNGANVASYTYTGPGRVKERAYGNNTKLTVDYDNNRRITNYESRTTANDLISGFEYAYDKEHNKLYEKRTHENKGDAYVYDSIYRVTGVKYGVPNTTLDPLASYDQYLTFDKQETFDLDDTGNRNELTITANGDSVITNYTPNDLNQYDSIQEGVNPAVGLGYDTNGNLTDDGVKTYKYDYANRLVEVRRKSDNITIANYAYDVFGRRVRKADNLSLVICYYYYDGGQIIEERDGSDIVVTQYVYGNGIDEVLQMTKYLAGNATQYYYHENVQGSTYAVTDQLGNVVERYRYDAYGKATFLDANGSPIAQSLIANRFLFTGREYDAETGLYYYRARCYSAELGRFLQRDPIGYLGGLNLYAYVHNNPVNYIDPYGFREEPKPSFWDRVKAGAGVFYGVGRQVVNGVVRVASNATELAYTGVAAVISPESNAGKQGKENMRILADTAKEVAKDVKESVSALGYGIANLSEIKEAFAEGTRQVRERIIESGSMLEGGAILAEESGVANLFLLWLGNSAGRSFKLSPRNAPVSSPLTKIFTRSPKTGPAATARATSAAPKAPTKPPLKRIVTVAEDTSASNAAKGCAGRAGKYPTASTVKTKADLPEGWEKWPTEPVDTGKGTLYRDPTNRGRTVRVMDQVTHQAADPLKRAPEGYIRYTDGYGGKSDVIPNK